MDQQIEEGQITGIKIHNSMLNWNYEYRSYDIHGENSEIKSWIISDY